MKIKKILVLVIAFITLGLFSCKGKSATGNLRFNANGEGFVANGFTDKTGWKINFTKVIINLGKISVTSKDKSTTIKLEKNYILDLKSTGNAIVLVDQRNNVATTEYRRLKWSMLRMTSGEFKGYSLVLIGKAVKDGKSIDFTIKINEELSWDCKEGYSGDVIKGIVKKGATGEVEMTFHFDHIFGDKGASPTTHVNTGSVGFDYFVKFAKEGKLVIDQQTLANKTDKKMYKKLLKALHGLGHSGEGHADVVSSTTAL